MILFPTIIEISFWGRRARERTAATSALGGARVEAGKPYTEGCLSSSSGPARPAGEWVTVEAEVHVKGDTKVFQYPDKAKPVLTFSGPFFNGAYHTTMGDMAGGYIALQSESQPVEFKDIEVMELKE
jgi:hypothetical protein